MKTPSTTTELRAALCETIAAVRAKEMTPDAAEAVSNASGKIIASLRVELEYRRMRGEVPALPFMDSHNAEVSEGGTRDSRIETAAQSRPSLH